MTTVVCEAMTRNPITIDPDAPLGTAVAVMRERGVRHLPVTDDAGRLVGIVTDRDLRSTMLAPAMTEWLGPGWRRHAEALGRRAENLRVRDVMTWNCVTTDGTVSLAQAAARMLDGKIGCLPVVLGGRLVGILTERDILRALRDWLPAIRGDADDYFP
jgi:acetoin utilization protein AcuB